MLGFAPISGQAISGSAFKLVAVAAALSAAGGLSFAGSARAGSVTRMSATGGIAFSATIGPTIRLHRSATGGLVFSANAHLSLAGRPFVTIALAEPYETIAQRVVFEVRAGADNFTVRGIR